MATGWRAKDRAKVSMWPSSPAPSMREHTTMIRRRARASTAGATGTGTRVSGRRDSDTATASMYGRIKMKNMKETGWKELRRAMESSLMQMEMFSRAHTSGEIVMALVSLSRVMGRREMKIIKRETSSTLLSPKMLSEQNYSINLKLSNKINFVKKK